MELETIKCIIILVLLFLPLFFTLLPFKLILYVQNADESRKERLHRVLSLLNCFSGGVFLGACLLDLLPDVQEMMGTLLDRISASVSFPVAEFTVVLGFFLVLIIEGVVASCHDAPSSDAEEAAPLLSAPSVNYGASGEHQSEGAAPAALLVSSSHSDGHGHSHSHVPNGGQAGIRSLLLVIALSLHSVIEGLAIGLQEEKDMLLQLFAAVAIHKGVLGFSLGLSLVRDGALSHARMWISALTFCAASPLGVAIGWAVTDADSSLAGNAANALLQGIACGTFLYITFFEVLPHEFRDTKDRLLRILAIVIGFSVVCGVLFLDPDVRQPRCLNQPAGP